MINPGGLRLKTLGARLAAALLAGGLIVLLLAGGVGGWAATTQIAGALIAQGSVVVDSNVKKVQHPTGGVVGKLNVQDGDRVKAGDILVQLDDTITRANLAIVTKGLDELAARKARLEAERDGVESVTFPRMLLAHTDDAPVAIALANERKLFELRRNARLGQNIVAHLTPSSVSLRRAPIAWTRAVRPAIGMPAGRGRSGVVRGHRANAGASKKAVP